MGLVEKGHRWGMRGWMRGQILMGFCLCFLERDLQAPIVKIRVLRWRCRGMGWMIH